MAEPQWFYVRDADGKVRPTEDLEEVARRWADLEGRRVAYTEVETPMGTLVVSTVFLCMDHNVFGRHPILYETVVYVKGPEDKGPGEDTGRSWRYATEGQAKKGHQEVVELLLREQDPGGLTLQEIFKHWEALKRE